MQFFIFRLLALIDDNHFPRGVEKDQFGICDPSLLRPFEAHLCLLGIASVGQSLPPSLKLPRPQLDRFLCSKQAAPTLITSCWAGLTPAAVSQQCTALPHHLKLCSRSSFTHLPALLCRVMAKPACVTYSIPTGRWSHQEQPFGGQPGSQNGKSCGYNSAGQVLRMTDVLTGGAPWWRSWQALSCGFWLRTHSTVRKPLTSLRWGSEYVSSPQTLAEGSYLYLSWTLYRICLLLL